jgi:hypothetical protein
MQMIDTVLQQAARRATLSAAKRRAILPADTQALIEKIEALPAERSSTYIT